MASFLSVYKYHARFILLLGALCIPVVLNTCSGDKPEHALRNTVKCTVIPEYRRTMKKVAVSLANGNTTLEMQRDLLDSLPGYARIVVLLPWSSVTAVSEELKNAPWGARTELVTFEPDIRDHGFFHFLAQGRDNLAREQLKKPLAVQQGTRWAQDLFEVGILPGGTLRLFVPQVHVCFWTAASDTDRNPTGDNEFVNSLSSTEMDVARLPIAFTGGNILFGESGGRRIALCGRDNVRDTRKINDSFRDCVVPESAFTDVIRNTFDVDDVIIISAQDIPQPTLLYHLDQAVVFLDDGVAGITKPVGEYPQNPKALARIREAAAYLEEVRTVLTDLGYRLIDIDTSIDNILRYEYYANAIPFINADTGGKTLLMPVFSDQPVQTDSEIVSGNIARFESLGYTVITVPSPAQAFKGGPHCLMNVIE
ncbi:hypothetical protein LLG96_15540 [bacterium]|nr:hypothetical protein [bacterium]